MGTDLLTASRMSSLLDCQRKHYWSYEVGLKATSDAKTLVFGKAWHAAMEARWRGMAYSDALAYATKDVIDLDELAIATLSGLLAAYYKRYSESEIVKELHPEIEFRLPIDGSRTFDSAGKIDGLSVLWDLRQCLFEHKTTSDSVEPGSDYWTRLRFNGQILQYVEAARRLGWDIQIVIYDVVRKPQIRQKKDETAEQFGERLAADAQERPEFYFARREVPILDQDLEEFAVQRYELGKLILSLRQAEKRCGSRPERAWARNVNMMSCRGCAYSGFCLQNISVDLNAPPAGFRVGPAHQELTAANQAA